MGGMRWKRSHSGVLHGEWRKDISKIEKECLERGPLLMAELMRQAISHCQKPPFPEACIQRWVVNSTIVTLFVKEVQTEWQGRYTKGRSFVSRLDWDSVTRCI